jgi:hypothetical protein
MRLKQGCFRLSAAEVLPTMNTSNPLSPLSSPSERSPHFASKAAPLPADGLGWRSEAFAEDLQGDAWVSTEPPQPNLRWHGVLQCAWPLAVAAVGGIVAYLNTLA